MQATVEDSSLQRAPGVEEQGGGQDFWQVLSVRGEAGLSHMVFLLFLMSLYDLQQNAHHETYAL